MIFRKHLLNVGLVLMATITTIHSIANNTEDEKIANNTKYEQITNNTEYDTKYTAINYNLPFVPFHYDVNILFYFRDNLLFGDCSININIDRQLNSIKLNSVSIRIIEAVLIDSKNTSMSKFSSFTNRNNILTINFDKEISPNTYTLNIMYARIIHEEKYYSYYEYQDKLGDRRLNETGIEIMKAPQLFPCRDELTINSTFKIAIKHDEDYNVLSNMPKRTQRRAKNVMMWTDFDESLPMSAKHILVVVITTMFTNVSVYSPLADVTIWCKESTRKHLLYAANVIEQVFPYFIQEYFIELPKLDIVVLRNRQDDNITTFGLILLREADIIYNEMLHSVIRKREVAHMIARQLAFLWCDDTLLWSKEGFATFFGAYILEQVYRNNHMMDLMVVQVQQDSFLYDTSSIANFPPGSMITSEVNSLLESSRNYRKSFIIWRMLYHLIPDEFWRGIRIYVDMHRIYSNMTISTPDDLWTTLQTIHNKSCPNDILSFYLKEIITSWITEIKYYPVLNITRNYKNYKNLTVTPNYMISPCVKNNIKLPVWTLVTLIKKSSLNFNTSDSSIWLIDSKITLFKFPLRPENSDWIIANIQQVGYYRVYYDFENWQKLMRYLNSEDYRKIHILNRAQIIDDAFYFLLQRELSYNMFWNLTNFVLRDTNFVTWYPMFKAFEFMTCIYPLEYGRETTEKIKDRIDQLLAEIGYFEKPADHTLTIYLREEAVKWACVLGVPECRRRAASELNKELENSVESSNLVEKKWIYCYGLATANYSIWYKIWQKWNTTSDERFLEYLTCSEDSTIICSFLNMTILEKAQPNEGKRVTNAFLFTVAKHAKEDKMHSCLFQIIGDIRLNSNRRNDIIATLIVIITHVHREEHIREITKFAMRYEEQIITAIKEKMRKRRLEYGRLIRNYGYFSLSAGRRYKYQDI